MERSLGKEELSELIFHAMSSRSELISRLTDPRRDIDDECGYPKTANLTAENYKDLYEREGVATRVVEVIPAESWKSRPVIYEDESEDTTTAFEEAWKSLNKDLLGESWYYDLTGDIVWEYLHRIDVLSGIGRYGILLLGIDDGKDLREPVAGIGADGRLTVETQPKRRLLYMRAFDESLAPITQWEADPSNPRFGKPIMYQVTLENPMSAVIAEGPSTQTVDVHWTRVIHVADHLGTSEIVGTPRMQPVFNRLYDLRKEYAGSAEMYWRGAFPGLSLETHPSLGGDVKIDADAIKTQLEQYMNSLQRYLALTGMTAKSLAPQVVDPTPQIRVQLEAICIRIGVPLRIFMGSERGELASSQDDAIWNERLSYRQSNYLIPRLIVPFVDRLIMIGVLPKPKQYSCYWPAMDALTVAEHADMAVKQMQAMSTYTNGAGPTLIPPVDFLTRVLKFDQDEAETMLKAVEKAGITPGSLIGTVAGIEAMQNLLKLVQERVITEDSAVKFMELLFKIDEKTVADVMDGGMPEPVDPIKEAEAIAKAKAVAKPPAKKPVANRTMHDPKPVED